MRNKKFYNDDDVSENTIYSSSDNSSDSDDS